MKQLFYSILCLAMMSSAGEAASPTDDTTKRLSENADEVFVGRIAFSFIVTGRSPIVRGLACIRTVDTVKGSPFKWILLLFAYQAPNREIYSSLQDTAWPIREKPSDQQYLFMVDTKIKNRSLFHVPAYKFFGPILNGYAQFVEPVQDSNAPLVSNVRLIIGALQASVMPKFPTTRT